MTTTCPACGSHIRDGETCDTCGPIVRDALSRKPLTTPKGGKKKNKGQGSRKITRHGKK